MRTIKPTVTAINHKGRAQLTPVCTQSDHTLVYNALHARFKKRRDESREELVKRGKEHLLPSPVKTIFSIYPKPVDTK